jgi:hypothetical protein
MSRLCIQDTRKNKFIIVKLYSVVLVAGILFIGCGDTEGTIDIKGIVIDEFTKDPIPRRKIIVKGFSVKDEKSVPIDSCQFPTDKSGCFTFSLRKLKDVSYYDFCFVGDSDYAYLSKKVSRFDLSRNAKYLSFTLNKLVDFEIKISRKSRAPNCDTLSVSWDSDGIDGKFLYPYYKIDNFDEDASYKLTANSELRWIGGNVKANIKTRAFEGKKTIVWWGLLRNGKKKDFKDTITCKRFVTNTVYLRY